MHMRHPLRQLGLAALALAWVHAGTSRAAEILSTDIISSDGVGDAVVPIAVRALAMSYDGTVHGTIVNNSSHPVRDPQLLVQYEWLWRNERHPGSDNPGFTDRVSVRGDIPPGGRLEFTHDPSEPLPQRTDGRFEPQASVLSFSEVMTSERSGAAW